MRKFVQEEYLFHSIWICFDTPEWPGMRQSFLRNTSTSINEMKNWQIKIYKNYYFFTIHKKEHIVGGRGNEGEVCFILDRECFWIIVLHQILSRYTPFEHLDLSFSHLANELLQCYHLFDPNNMNDSCEHLLRFSALSYKKLWNKSNKSAMEL